MRGILVGYEYHSLFILQCALINLIDFRSRMYFCPEKSKRISEYPFSDILSLSNTSSSLAVMVIVIPQCPNIIYCRYVEAVAISSDYNFLVTCNPSSQRLLSDISIVVMNNYIDDIEYT